MKRLFTHLLLFAESGVSWSDRIYYACNSFMHIAPVAFVLNLIGWWWTDNEQFGNFMSIALIVNAIVGIYFHVKYNTFNFKDFLLKNFEMTFVIIAGYVMLEMLRYTAGDNYAGEAFKIIIQICTLLYPASKVVKNLFIITKGKYPPKFFMERLYNFEKNGDLNDFFNKKKD